MTLKQSIASALQAFTVLLFLGAGVGLLVLPSIPEARILLSDLILTREDVLLEAGIGLLVVALFFLFGFYGLNRGYYLILNMGKNTLAVDEKVLWRTIEPELKKQFLSRISLEHIEIGRGRKLSFGIDMEAETEDEAEELLLSAEEHLETLLRERFGYRRPFTVQVFPRAISSVSRDRVS